MCRSNYIQVYIQVPIHRIFSNLGYFLYYLSTKIVFNNELAFKKTLHHNLIISFLKMFHSTLYLKELVFIEGKLLKNSNFN